MGYELNELLRDLDSTGMTLSNLFTDIVRMIIPKGKPELPGNRHF